MTREAKITWTLLILIGAGVLLFWLYPDIEEELAPEPVRAWVAVEVAGSGVARDGWTRLETGTGFTLHAVLESRGRDGSAVYYTDAPGLELGGEAVSAESLRPWDRRPAKIRWFSIEGGRPYFEVSSLEELEKFRFEEVFRPDWPTTWSIPGRLEASSNTVVRDALREEQAGFGTQRYHVRIEIYDDTEALVPEERFKSPGAELLPAHAESFPTVTAYVPGVLQPPTEVFGLTQIEVEGPEAEVLLERILQLSRQRLAFGRVPLIRQMAASAGKEVEELEWRPLDLGSRPPWAGAPGEAGVHPGDLLQFVDRVVVLYQDRGETGILDPEDLCLDFAHGAAVRLLGQVFEGEGELSWIPLTEGE